MGDERGVLGKCEDTRIDGMYRSLFGNLGNKKAFWLFQTLAH